VEPEAAQLDSRGSRLGRHVTNTREISSRSADVSAGCDRHRRSAHLRLFGPFHSGMAFHRKMHVVSIAIDIVTSARACASPVAPIAASRE
jgi:hypothetical protein